MRWVLGLYRQLFESDDSPGFVYLVLLHFPSALPFQPSDAASLRMWASAPQWLAQQHAVAAAADGLRAEALFITAILLSVVVSWMKPCDCGCGDAKRPRTNAAFTSSSSITNATAHPRLLQTQPSRSVTGATKKRPLYLRHSRSTFHSPRFSAPSVFRSAHSPLTRSAMNWTGSAYARSNVAGVGLGPGAGDPNPSKTDFSTPKRAILRSWSALQHLRMLWGENAWW